MAQNVDCRDIIFFNQRRTTGEDISPFSVKVHGAGGYIPASLRGMAVGDFL